MTRRQISKFHKNISTELIYDPSIKTHWKAILYVKTSIRKIKSNLERNQKAFTTNWIKVYELYEFLPSKLVKDVVIQTARSLKKIIL